MQFLNPLIVQLEALQQSPYHWLIIPIAILSFILTVRIFCSVCIYLVSPFGSRYSILVGLILISSVGLIALLVYNPEALEHIFPSWQYSLGYGLVSITGLFMLLAIWKLFRSIIVTGFWAAICLLLVGAVFFDRSPQEWLNYNLADMFKDSGIKQFNTLMQSKDLSSVELDQELQLKLIHYLPELGNSLEQAKDL